MVEVTEYIKKCAEKLSTTEEEIKKDYDKLLAEEKEIHKDLSEEDQQVRALQRLAMIFKKQLRSPAVGFEGMIIGVSDVVDTVARVRREAIESFKSNPEKTTEAGVTDSEGNPLDTRKTWSTGNDNFNFGKPLPEHNWLRNVYGVALQSGKEGAPKFFSISVSGQLAQNKEWPIFKPVRFRAINRSKDESAYSLNASAFTNFEEDAAIQLPEPEELLNKYCKDMIVEFSDLESYHNEVKDNFNRLAIIKGDVSVLVLEPTSVGSRRLVLEDDKNILEDLESQGITCWIPPSIDINFAEQSKIMVIGRTSQGFKRDEQGNATEELGDVMINAYGLYAIPDFKIQPKDVKEMTEEDLNLKEDISEPAQKPTIPNKEASW